MLVSRNVSNNVATLNQDKLPLYCISTAIGVYCGSNINIKASMFTV